MHDRKWKLKFVYTIVRDGLRETKKSSLFITGHFLRPQRNNIFFAQVVLKKWKRQESGKNLDEFLIK